MIGTGPLINEGPPSPGVPRGFKLGDSLRMLLRQIVLLGAVGRHVEKLPGLSVTEDQLPFPVAHRFVSLVLPEDRLRPGQRLSKDSGAEADTLHRLDGIA